MATPVYVAGQVLDADDCNNWFLPLVAYKPTDQSLTNNVTLQNDSALVIAVAANALYEFRIFLGYEGGTQGSSDIKFGFTVPASTTMRWVRDGTTTSGTRVSGLNWNTESSTATLGTSGAGVGIGGLIFGSIDTSSTAGNVQFQWAQSTLSATATKVYAGSVLVAQRVG